MEILEIFFSTFEFLQATIARSTKPFTEESVDLALETLR